MDYNQYDQIYFQIKEDSKNKTPLPNIGEELQQEFGSSMSALEKNLGFACIDGNCCGNGTTYNITQGKCVINPSSSTSNSTPLRLSDCLTPI